MSSENKKDTLGDRFKPRVPLPPRPHQKAGTAEAEDEAVRVLSGDLKEKPIAWLLRAAQHYEVTGVLSVGSAACAVSVQFGLGRAVHAYHPFCKGSEAIMDLFNWQDGRVKFEPGKHPESASIQESTEELLVRGEQYVQNLQFLDQQYINEMSFLVRPPKRMSEAEIKRRLARGQRLIDHDLQMEFYSNIYGTRNLKDTAEKMNLTTSQWVSITANLLQLGILNTPDGRSVEFPEPTTTLELSTVDIGAPELTGPPADQASSATNFPVVPPGAGMHPQSMQANSFPPGAGMPQVQSGGFPVSQAQSMQSNTFPPGQGMQQPAQPGGFPQSPSMQPNIPPPGLGMQPHSQSMQSNTFPPGAGMQSQAAQSNTIPPARAGWNAPPPGWDKAPPGWDHSAQVPTASGKLIKLGVPTELVSLDPRQREQVYRKLSSADTNIFTFDVLHFFLEREFARAARFKTTLALMLFCVRFEASQEVPAEACAQLTRAVNQIKREVDMLGHFGETAFGLLLPMVESTQACSLAERINSDLHNVCPELVKHRPVLHFGIASVPQDALDLMGLVNAAQVSMMHAAHRNVLLLEAKNLSSQAAPGAVAGGPPAQRNPAASPAPVSPPPGSAPMPGFPQPPIPAQPPQPPIPAQPPGPPIPAQPPGPPIPAQPPGLPQPPIPAQPPGPPHPPIPVQPPGPPQPPQPPGPPRPPGPPQTAPHPAMYSDPEILAGPSEEPLPTPNQLPAPPRAPRTGASRPAGLPPAAAPSPAVSGEAPSPTVTPVTSRKLPPPPKWAAPPSVQAEQSGKQDRSPPRDPSEG